MGCVQAMTPPIGARERLLVVFASVAWVAFLWVLMGAGGALGIARSDDWSYLLTQFDFARTGEFVMNNWAVTMLVGQTILAAPVVAMFGESIVALQAFVAVFAVLALVMTYVIIRLVLAPIWTFFAVALLAVSPIFGPSAVSFMTDVPALFFLTVALWCGARAVGGDASRQWLWIVGSAVFSVIAFTFRDYALLAFAPVIVVALVRERDTRSRFFLGVIAFGAIAVAGALYAWRHSLSNDLRLDGWSIDFSVTLVARGVLTIALLVLPVMTTIRWNSVFGAYGKRRILSILGSLLVAGAVLVIARFELLGNVIHPYASTWLISGPGIRIWSLWVNRLLILAGAVSFALVLMLLLAGIRNRKERSLSVGFLSWVRIKPVAAIIGLFPVVMLGAHAGATIALGTWFIDRYFILFLPFLAAALMMMGAARGWLVSGRWRALAFAFLAVYALIGVHVTDFDARFDGARWELGRELVAEGYAPEAIDAGMQWVSFHAQSIGLGAQEVPTREGRPWWTERYPDQEVCATVFSIDGVLDALPTDALAFRDVRTVFGREFSLIAVPGPDTCGAGAP